MEIIGNLKKMRVQYAEPVTYYLPVGDHEIFMNALIGNEISIEYLGEINCIRCGRKTSKSFAQGYCYPCFISAPETEDCVLRPELCRAHEGVSRDMVFAKSHCLIEHIVYLSLTSDIKVGVTRNTQVPTRWIDQGAVRAVELARTPNRYFAGKMEVELKAHIGDKTNWRRMLKNEVNRNTDLLGIKNQLGSLLSDDLVRYRSNNDTITEIDYPVSVYPQKVTGLNFDKQSIVKGILIGIKGQYLLFEGNQVINIRKFGGYRVRINL